MVLLDHMEPLIMTHVACIKVWRIILVAQMSVLYMYRWCVWKSNIGHLKTNPCDNISKISVD